MKYIIKNILREETQKRTLPQVILQDVIKTFKNSIELQKTFLKIPIDRIMIETDSPFLAPEPMRGKKNEPSFIKYN